MSAASTVFAHRVERQRGTVHLHVSTDKGNAVHRLTPALARVVGRELVQASVDPAPAAQPAPGAPVLKPGGTIL